MGEWNHLESNKNINSNAYLEFNNKKWKAPIGSSYTAAIIGSKLANFI